MAATLAMESRLPSVILRMARKGLPPAERRGMARGMAFNMLSSPLVYLQSRRSGRPREMGAPGPSAEQLRIMAEIALRSPDHGKLGPTRFVIVEDRDALQTLLLDAYAIDRPKAGKLEIEAAKTFAHQAPALVVALHSPTPESHIPLWEQELSTGASLMNLLHAAHAMGFVGGWLTGWATYSDKVRDAFGESHEKIAGFVFLGSATKELEERPRPDPGTHISSWPS